MHRLIYRSQSLRPIDWALVHEILEVSERNNAAHGLSGILLATEREFLQVLEGESLAVAETYQRISQDTRHRDLHVIADHVVPDRLFGQWAMHDIGIFDFNASLSFQLAAQYGDGKGGIRFPDSEAGVLAMIQDIRVARD